jgi:hypothetical protein
VEQNERELDGKPPGTQRVQRKVQKVEVRVGNDVLQQPLVSHISHAVVTPASTNPAATPIRTPAVGASIRMRGRPNRRRSIRSSRNQTTAAIDRVVQQVERRRTRSFGDRRERQVQHNTCADDDRDEADGHREKALNSRV